MSFADIFDIVDSKTSINVEIGQNHQLIAGSSNAIYVEPYVSKIEKEGTNYAEEIKKMDDEDYVERCRHITIGGDISCDETASSVANLEDLTTIGTRAPDDIDTVDHTYEHYDWNCKSSESLPIDAVKKQIVNHAFNNRVTIIQGHTGCGKSTQVPYYILERFKDQKKSCNIVVTQPRRLAAVSVAERVCDERKWRIGDIVGYQIGLNRVASPNTKILFCTTGVLLQKIVKQKTLNPFDFIILDEVHERDKDMDFLMLVIKKFMRKPGPGLKNTRLILMSATLNIFKLEKYFSTFTPEFDKMISPRVIEIDVKEKFDVRKYYIEELVPNTDEDAQRLYRDIPSPNQSKPQIVPKLYKFVCKLITTIERNEPVKKGRGAILVFLPGIHEITELHSFLEEEKQYAASANEEFKWSIIILHSTIPKEQQDMVFKRPPPDVRKIVLSTNIAESSITVPDVSYVIDFCLTKILSVAEGSNYSTLQMAWASLSSCKQRAGRVGRTQEGRVFLMVTKDFYKTQLPVEDTPEIIRSPLDSLILHAKMLDMGPPVYIFGLAMDPPDISNIKRTILSLKEIGALFPTTYEGYMEDDGDLTYMGEVMSSLPVDPRVAKLIYLGYVFNILNDCIIMAAAMSVKSPFSAPYREEMQAYESKLVWADSTCSDLIAFLHLYNVWHSQKSRGRFDRSKTLEKEWARSNFVQISSLREIEKLVVDIQLRLERHGIQNNPNIKIDKERSLLRLIVIGGAFYPNYYFRKRENNFIDEKEALKTLCGHDPYNTVYMKNLPPLQAQCISLYAAEIKQQLKFCREHYMKVSAESSKVFIQFKDSNSITRNNEGHIDHIPGKVNKNVFKAVKYRMINNYLRINTYRTQIVEKKIEELNLKKKLKEKQISNETPFRPINNKFVRIRITHIENLTKFWCQAEEKIPEIQFIFKQLNSNPDPLVSLTSPPKIRGVYAAPFADNELSKPYYYRAKVVSFSKKNVVTVHFIDYGNDVNVNISQLRNFGPTLEEEEFTIRRPLAFECALAEVTPSMAMKEHHGLWSRESIEWFRLNFENRPEPLSAEIYSIVHGVVKLILYKQDRPNVNETINEKVRIKRFADYTEEPYESKVDHDNRQREIVRTGVYDVDLEEDGYDDDDNRENDDKRCNITELKGPYSPLEIQLYASTQSVDTKPVHIDRESINCVLLDTEPQDAHERVLVASFVTADPNSEYLKVRETTLMPNFRGFSTLLCMLFSPQVELRADSSRTKVIGALCGLGYRMNENGKFEALYPDNDLEIRFDIKVDNKYLTLINSLRLYLDRAISEDASDIIEIQQYCHQYLMQLVETHYEEVIDDDRFPRKYQWGQIPNKFLRNPEKEDPEIYHPCETSRHVYHLIWGIVYNPVTAQQYNLPLLTKNLDAMHKLAECSNIMEAKVTCKLCNVYLENQERIRIHMNTKLHLNQVEKFQQVVKATRK